MNKMILNERELLKKVDDRLALLLNNDSAFESEFQSIQVYYWNKFAEILAEEDRENYNKWLQKSMTEQFQNGYLMVEQYYNLEGAYIDESIFKEPEGIFRENVPNILREMLRPLLEQDVSFDEIIDTDTTHKFIITAVEKYEHIRPLIKQTSFDLTCLGARQALKDRSYLMDVKPMDINTEERMLGNIGDYQFINPEMYIKINHVSPNVEYWDIHYWSSNLQGITKIGEVLVISEQDYIETKTKLTYNLSMLNILPQSEIDKVAEYHIAKLLNYMSEEEIQYNLTVVEQFLTQVSD